MKPKNSPLTRAIHTILACSAFLPLASSVGDPMSLPPGDFPPATFPKEIQANSGYGLVAYEYSSTQQDDIGVEISWNVVGRSLHIGWGASPEGPASEGLSVGLGYVLPFWPTAIAASPSTKGVVYAAGWTERGRTRILRISLTAPSLGVTQVPGGGQAFSLAPGVVQSVREIYDAPTAVVGFIGNLFENRQDPGKMFVHRFPGGTIDSLVLSTGVRTPVATAAPSTAPFVESGLAGPYDMFASLEHQDYGYAYTLLDMQPSSSQGSMSPLVYMDTDKDGDIDTVQVLPAQAYGALGLFDPNKVIASN